MHPNQTTVGKPRKQVLTPPDKPIVKEDSFVTPRGANIDIRFTNTGLYYVVFTDGGVLPSELSGKWTDRTLAEEAVKKYLDKYWKGR